MTDTVNLGLPCIEGSQAQKHVTHNEALRILDTLVQLAVLDRDLTAPPGSPTEGQRWIVNTTATGAWTGHDNAIAAWQDGAWQFCAPQTGWLAYVVDEGALLAWSGSAWVDAMSALTSLNNMTLLGVGTTADATNPFSVKLNNTLLTARTAAEGGDGDLRYKMSKEAAANTLSLLFQDNFSGRAEIGLTGDDDLHFKVSPDGTTWYDGIVIDKGSGAVTFPNSSITGGGRELLTANRTYYVRSDGSDSNDGLTNASGGAFATIQKAIDVVATLDLSIYAATVKIGVAGTYAGCTIAAPFVGGPGSYVVIDGDAAAPGSYVISSKLRVESYGQVRIQGVDFTSSDWAIDVENYGACFVTGAVIFGSCASGHMNIQANGTVKVSADYEIDGGAPWHVICGRKSYWSGTGLTITITGTPAFANHFANASHLSLIDIYANTFSGSATGVRYVSQLNSEIFTAGGGATYLPGNSSGSTATGGLYV